MLPWLAFAIKLGPRKILPGETKAAPALSFPQIPYSTEQGILILEQGIFLAEQGIFMEEQGNLSKPHFLQTSEV